MLSITAIKSAGQATHYYAADNYYTKAAPEAKATSQWWGKGAAALGLKGEIEPADFKALLQGHLPQGHVLGRYHDGEWQHRPGYDLTFSAPKSISLLAEIGRDTRLYAAHAHAVHTALQYLQAHAAQTRIKRQGDIRFEKTDNLLVAQFRHDTSRAQDPQLHTHCVVLNATQRQDGAWRSLSSEKLFECELRAKS